MERVECYYDDVAQIYFAGKENLKYEYVQAFKCFGFNDFEMNTSVSEIDNLLLNKKAPIVNSIKNEILNYLLDERAILKFEVFLEEQKTNNWAFGFPELAIVIDKISVWLLIRESNCSQDEFMSKLIADISMKYDLFLVDNQQGFIVESNKISNVIEYFNHID
jgi:hypothetical protein